MKEIYLIEDQGNSPGRIYAAFSSLESAEAYLNRTQDEDCGIIAVTLYASAREALLGKELK